MFRCSLFFAGAALWACASSAPAESLFFADDFETGDLASRSGQWSFGGVAYGLPAIRTTRADLNGPLPRTRFLGEFGGGEFPDPLHPLETQNEIGDLVRLNLTLPERTTSVRLQFDVYLLRTWDGQDVTFAGPDVFGYGYNDQTLLSATFSNGEGMQGYCPIGNDNPCLPATGSDPAQKNKLGFEIELDPVTGGPPVGTKMSLAYHITTEPIPYAQRDISFFFFSDGLQVAGAGIPGDPILVKDGETPLHVADESWGLDNVHVLVEAAAVPEPATWAMTLAGLTLLLLAAVRRGRA